MLLISYCTPRLRVLTYTNTWGTFETAYGLMPMSIPLLTDTTPSVTVFGTRAPWLTLHSGSLRGGERGRDLEALVAQHDDAVVLAQHRLRLGVA